MSKFILDTRLSNAQYTICIEAIRRGIIEPEDLNEGLRTMGEQWAFYRNQPPLAAFPSPLAPHIKKGFNNQAVDGNSLNGAIQRLAQFYQSLGIPVAFNVSGESWHMDVLSHLAVVAAAKKIRKERSKAVLNRGDRQKAVKFLKYQLHYILDPQTKLPYFKPGETRPNKGYPVTFGTDLESAVKRFQGDHKLKADGEVGPLTDRKIDRAYATQKRKRRSAKDRARARKTAAERGEL